ncbi:hydroxyisourate hydrolase [Cohnella suwonensis]|uniref:5-hydroxyisourate hydrolase n=1 Tax=Cohnella suwonensis TaxID=696072 RepID=A0ABW0M326_9BACL
MSGAGAGGRITTHVLDTAHGVPAAGMAVSLWRAAGEDGAMERIADAIINSDGRVDAPLLAGEAFRAGEYEIVFEAGRYFKDERGVEPLLFVRIPIRFRVADPGSHYHVPLLVAPAGYSTYRGS